MRKRKQGVATLQGAAVAGALALLVSPPAALAQDPARERHPEIQATPPRVIDADTLRAGGERVRLQGIDAPESAQECRGADGGRYLCGDQATRALRERIGRGTVTCKIEGRDRYQRALGICYAADGTDLNGWLVSQGHALAYRRYSTRYVGQEDQARSRGAGIWAGAFVPPWDWRRGKRLEEAGRGS